MTKQEFKPTFAREFPANFKSSSKSISHAKPPPLVKLGGTLRYLVCLIRAHWRDQACALRAICWRTPQSRTRRKARCPEHHDARWIGSTNGRERGLCFQSGFTLADLQGLLAISLHNKKRNQVVTLCLSLQRSLWSLCLLRFLLPMPRGQRRCGCLTVKLVMSLKACSTPWQKDHAVAEWRMSWRSNAVKLFERFACLRFSKAPPRCGLGSLRPNPRTLPFH